MLEFVLLILLVFGFGWLIWVSVVAKLVHASSHVAEAAGQNDPNARGREERPDLRIGQEVDPERRIDTLEAPYPSEDLHAMHTGQHRALCGAEVREIDRPEATWPPAMGSTCYECQRMVAEDEGSHDAHDRFESDRPLRGDPNT